MVSHYTTLMRTKFILDLMIFIFLSQEDLDNHTQPASFLIRFNIWKVIEKFNLDLNKHESTSVRDTL